MGVLLQLRGTQEHPQNWQLMLRWNPKVSATFYSSVRSSLFCRTAALTIVYLSFIDSNSLCSFSYKVPAVMILPSV